MSKLNMNELENVSGGQISSDAALKAALDAAGLKKNQVRVKKNKLDMDDGILKYEIEFNKGFTEYEYDIDANTGAVIGFSQDLFD